MEAIFKPGIPHKLGPAKTESAEGVARLTLAGEKEDCLLILVLHPFQRLPVESGTVGG